MYYYRSSLLGALILRLGLWLIFTLWLLSILQSSCCGTVFLGYKVLNVLAFFLYMTLSLVLMR